MSRLLVCLLVCDNGRLYVLTNDSLFSTFGFYLSVFDEIMHTWASFFFLENSVNLDVNTHILYFPSAGYFSCM